MIGQELVIVQPGARPARKAEAATFKHVPGPNGVQMPKHFPAVEARPAGEPGWVLTAKDENGNIATVYLTDEEARAIGRQFPADARVASEEQAGTP